MSLAVEAVGAGESRRTRTYHGHTLACTLGGDMGRDESLEKRALHYGAFVLADGDRLMLFVEHAPFLAQRRTYAAREFGEVVGSGQQGVGSLDVVFVESVLPFGLFVAQRTAPVAERYAAFHTARCLQTAVLWIECLLHFAVVAYTVGDRTVAGLFSIYSQKCFRISHIVFFVYEGVITFMYAVENRVYYISDCQ